MDEEIGALLRKHAFRARSARERRMQARLDRLDAGRPYIDSIRSLVVDCGLTPRQAFKLAEAEGGAESRDDYDQLLYKIACLYAAAVSLSAILATTKNPWEFDDFLFLLITLDSDAYHYAKRLQQLEARKVEVH